MLIYIDEHVFSKNVDFIQYIFHIYILFKTHLLYNVLIFCESQRFATKHVTVNEYKHVFRQHFLNIIVVFFSDIYF